MVTIGLLMVWHSESAGQASRCRKCGNGQLWDTCGTILDNARLLDSAAGYCHALTLTYITESTQLLVSSTTLCHVYVMFDIRIFTHHRCPTIYDDVIRHQSSCPQRGCKKCWANICRGRKHWITGAGKLGQDLACFGNLCGINPKIQKILRY